jgi:hypothetical protein
LGGCVFVTGDLGSIKVPSLVIRVCLSASTGLTLAIRVVETAVLSHECLGIVELGTGP